MSGTRAYGDYIPQDSQKLITEKEVKEQFPT